MDQISKVKAQDKARATTNKAKDDQKIRIRSKVNQITPIIIGHPAKYVGKQAIRPKTTTNA